MAWPPIFNTRPFLLFVPLKHDDKLCCSNVKSIFGKKVMKNMWADPLSFSILNISEMEGPSDEVWSNARDGNKNDFIAFIQTCLITKLTLCQNTRGDISWMFSNVTMDRAFICTSKKVSHFLHWGESRSVLVTLFNKTKSLIGPIGSFQNSSIQCIC